MFMVTLGKQNLRRAVAVVLVVAVVGGLWLGRAHFAKDVQGGNMAKEITTAQDIQTYFTGYGIAIDTEGLSADKVQVPTTWDENFMAFNEIVSQSGCDLETAKGKTVEKWVATVPEHSTGEVTQYAVLLLDEGKVVGAYLLEKPSGEVTGLEDAVIAMAELRANSGADSGSALNDGEGTLNGNGVVETSADFEVSADVETPPQPVDMSAPEVAPSAPESTPYQSPLTADFGGTLAPNADGYPVE